MFKKLLVFVCIGFIIFISNVSEGFSEEYKFEDIVRCETDRLVLEPTTYSDLNVLSEYLLDSNVTKYLYPLIEGNFSSKEKALKF